MDRLSIADLEKYEEDGYIDSDLESRATRQLVATMRVLEAYRDAWMDNESEPDMMEKLAAAENLSIKLLGEYQSKDSDNG